MTDTINVGQLWPICPKHKEQMALYFHERLGEMSNNWECRSCCKERVEQAPTKISFPEDAEL